MTPSRKQIPVPFAAVEAWAEENGQESQVSDSEKDTVIFGCEQDGHSYEAKAILRDSQSITVVLISKIPKVTDELAFRKELDELQLVVQYGAFIYYHEHQLLVWRDTISSAETDGSDFDVDLFGGLIGCGFDAFATFRFNFSELFGATAADVKLARAAVAGRA